MKNFRKTFAHNSRSLREENGLSIKDLTRISGISTNNILRRKDELGRVNFEKLPILAKIFDIKTENSLKKILTACRLKSVLNVFWKNFNNYGFAFNHQAHLAFTRVDAPHFKQV